MCGICGFSGQKNFKLLKRMCDTLIHRGPDDEGYYYDGAINLGIRRLSIVDIEYGKQPVYNEQKNIVLVFNGEIYNHVELRRTLEEKGHKFRSHHSDSEVVVHLYEEFGEDWVDWVNGMFALAIWDKREKKIMLYRDRMGIKPLYYALVNGELIFGSEIKALLKHPDISSELDFAALYNYFGMKNISGLRTAYIQIRQLLPGSYLIWRNSKFNIGTYWRIDFGRPLTDITEKEAVIKIRELLDDSVRLRMRCDVPYGAYLSGGIDSSMIVTLMSRHQTQPVKTFSLGYEDEFKDDLSGKATDIEYARKISKILGTQHFEYIMNASEIPKYLPQVLQAFDEPFSGTISTFFLSILISKHVKVALSGDGSDELFGSYLTHRLSWPIHYYLELVKAGKTELKQMNAQEKSRLFPFDDEDSFRFMKDIAHPDIVQWRSALQVFNRDELLNLLTPKFLNEVKDLDTTEIYRQLYDTKTAVDPLNLSLEFDQKELLPNQILHFVDRLSMAHSIEVRVPFLDYRLVEFVAKVPGDLKITRGVNKYIWKQAAKGILPEEIIERPKEGFVLPVFNWIDGKLKDYVRQVLSPDRIAKHSFWDKDYVSRLIEENCEGKVKHSAKLWNLVCFQIWWETLD